MKTSSRYAAQLGGDLAIVHKRRLSGSKVEAQEIIGEVSGRNILMCDDIIATAGTLCSAASLIKERGADKIYVGASHGVFAQPALDRLAKAPIDRVVVTDTIPQSKMSKKIGNIKVLSVAAMLGEAIKRIHRNESVSNLFNNI
jgi:ribose-phosphate pyrophosphokinase